MHFIIFPPSLVVAAIFENVFPFSMFQIVLLLTYVTISVGVLLLHIDQLLLLLHSVLTAFAELTVSHR